MVAGGRGFAGGGHFASRPSVTSLGPRGFTGGMGFHGGRTAIVHHPTPRAFARPFVHDRFFFRNRWPYYGYYGYYYPYYPYGYFDYDYSDYSANDYPRTQDNSALYAEIQRLRDDIADLREAQARAAEQSDARPPQAPRPQAKAETTPAPAYPPVSFVFRDGRQLEARNYAIVGYNFWIMDDGMTKRYPLSQLDLQATARINEERGVPFQLPGH